MLEENTKWYHLSVCKDMKINYFFDDYEADSLFATVIDEVCMSCPVRAMCKQEGMENNETGVWGGIFLTNGKPDKIRNAHKTDEVWAVVNSD